MNDMDSAYVRDVIISDVTSISAQIEGAIERIGSFAVAYRLIPFRDGNQWCVLLGDDLQSGIAGFGDSPAQAIAAFDVAMYSHERHELAAVKDSLTTDAAAPALAAAPDADGWIEWKGGEHPPVGPDVVVQWRDANGACYTAKSEHLYWGHDQPGDFDNIVAYRVAAQETTNDHP